MTKLTEYFIPQRNVIHERCVFQSRQQLANESVEEFARELAVHCEYKEQTLLPSRYIPVQSPTSGTHASTAKSSVHLLYCPPRLRSWGTRPHRRQPIDAHGGGSLLTLVLVNIELYMCHVGPNPLLRRQLIVLRLTSVTLPKNNNMFLYYSIKPVASIIIYSVIQGTLITFSSTSCK